MFLYSLFERKKCPHCQAKLGYVGEDIHYIKFSYYVCEEETCDFHSYLLNYKNGNFQSKLPLKVLAKEKKKAYLFHVESQEQYWQKYE